MGTHFAEMWNGREGDPMWDFVIWKVRQIDPDTMAPLGPWVPVPGHFAAHMHPVHYAEDVLLFTDGFSVLAWRVSNNSVTSVVPEAEGIIYTISVSPSGVVTAGRTQVKRRVLPSRTQLRQGDVVYKVFQHGAAAAHYDGGIVCIQKCTAHSLPAIWMVSKTDAGGHFEYSVPVARDEEGGQAVLVVNGVVGTWNLATTSPHPKRIIGVSRDRGFVVVAERHIYFKVLVPDGLRMHFIRAALAVAFQSP